MVVAAQGDADTARLVVRRDGDAIYDGVAPGDVTDDGLDDDTTYHYRAVAYDAAGNASIAATATAVTPDRTAPAAPPAPDASGYPLHVTWPDDAGTTFTLLRDGTAIAHTTQSAVTDADAVDNGRPDAPGDVTVERPDPERADGALDGPRRPRHPVPLHRPRRGPGGQHRAGLRRGRVRRAQRRRRVRRAGERRRHRPARDRHQPRADGPADRRQAHHHRRRGRRRRQRLRPLGSGHGRRGRGARRAGRRHGDHADRAITPSSPGRRWRARPSTSSSATATSWAASPSPRSPTRTWTRTARTSTPSPRSARPGSRAIRPSPSRSSTTRPRRRPRSSPAPRRAPASATPSPTSWARTRTTSPFSCALDDATAAPCTSPWALTGLASGEHHVSIAATDAAGNADATPVTTTFTVDLTAPGAPTLTAVADHDLPAGSAQGRVNVTADARRGRRSRGRHRGRPADPRRAAAARSPTTCPTASS